MCSLGRSLLLFSLASYFRLVSSQSVHAFNWGFGPDFVQTSFQECESRPITLIPLNASTLDIGVPPYYMVEYSPRAVTIPVLIGNDASHLSWRVNHPKGSQLLLSVIDSAGQSGGFTSDFFDVLPGDSSCQPPLPSNPAVVSPNVSTSITTCQPWGLSISGGLKPYNISLAAVASPVITNVSMGSQDDVFTFINRADPGTRILAAVVDATGQWGISSIAVKTTGSSDTTCLGLISSSKTKAQINSQFAATPATNAKVQQKVMAFGIVFGLILPLFLAAGLFWWWRRKRSLAQGSPQPYLTPDPDIQERADIGPPSLNINTKMGPMRVDTQLQRTRSWVVDFGRQTDSPTSIDMTTADIQPSASAGSAPFLTSSQLPSALTGFCIRSPDTQIPVSAVTRSSPFVHSEQQAAFTPNSTSPAAMLSPAQRYRKQLEALAEAQPARLVGTGSESGAGSRPQRSQSATSIRPFPTQPLPRRAGSSLRMPLSVRAANIIIQHRDGGVVEELPPPYCPSGLRTPGPPPGSPSPPPSVSRGQDGFEVQGRS